MAALGLMVTTFALESEDLARQSGNFMWAAKIFGPS